MKKWSVCGVVMAAGYGYINDGKSKLTEPLSADGRIAVLRPVVDLVQSITEATVVVVNPHYSEQVSQLLGMNPRVSFVQQPKRTGTAGALKLCLPVWKDTLDTGLPLHALVLYGDMPFWRRESIERLIDDHIASKAVISMFSIPLKGNGLHVFSAVQNFGRILWDKNGKIIAIREPWELTKADLKKATHVNPSAWVIDLHWFQSVANLLEPHDKGDGFPEEYWLPDLVALAHQSNLPIQVRPLLDSTEAMGVNTAAQLRSARALYKKVRRNSQITVVVDFDRTLLDTDKLKQLLAKSLQPLGVSEQLFFRLYRSAIRTNTDGVHSYDVRKHLVLLTKHVKGFPKQKALRNLYGMLEQSSRCLIPYAERWLARMYSRRFDLILLTHGPRVWQRRKIAGSGLARFFNVSVVQNGTPKATAFTKLVRSKKDVVFVTDSVREAVRIQQKHPSVAVVVKLVNSEAQRQAKQRGLPAAYRLKEIELMINRAVVMLGNKSMREKVYAVFSKGGKSERN